MGEHRLFERGERPRLDDIGRDGAGQRGEDQRRQPAGQREHRSGAGHHNEEQAVAAAPPDSVAVAREQQRDECDPREERGEDGADFGAGDATPGEADADQHGAEAVGEGTRCLRGDDPARVRAQGRSS